jgi:hypothetical protein
VRRLRPTAAFWHAGRETAVSPATAAPGARSLVLPYRPER